jgi:hypothetical protein
MLIFDDVSIELYNNLPNRRHMIKNVKMIMVVLCILAQLKGYSQEEKRVKEGLDLFASLSRPQKIYLHFDKNEYQSGEIIWFKAYLFDGISHIPDTRSNNIYVELISIDGSTRDMRILRSKNGFSEGDLLLTDRLPDGNYIIKAYTDWMKNFGEEFYFTRHMYIINNEYEDIIPRREVRQNRRFNRQIENMGRDHRIAFFPEGGHLLEGVTGRIAFRVVDNLGRGQEVDGEIIDNNGNVIKRVQTDHSGIGVFEITPEKGKTYHARLSINDRYRSYDLPESRPEGYAIRVDQDGEHIGISIASSFLPENRIYSQKLILVGHTRGMPGYDTTFYLPGGTTDIHLRRDKFPMGVTHFTLFTADHKPVAERLIYIDSGDELNFDTRFDIKRVNGNDYIDIQVQVANSHGDPVEGSFSLSAVTGRPVMETQSYSDILTYILLASELEGPSEKFTAQKYAVTGEMVDHLLLTFGWRRFTWDDVIAGNFRRINFEPAKGISLSGRLYDPAREESLTNYPVHLEVMSGHDEFYSTSTGRKGHFTFSGLAYDGLIDIKLSSMRLPGDYPPVMELILDEGRDFSYTPGIYTHKQSITRRGDNWKRTRGISPPSHSSINERHVTPKVYGTPDQTIFIDYNTLADRTMFDVLRNRATGLSFDRGQILIRGRSSLYLDNEARFMVDGMFVNRETFLNLYPREVERIEIFRGTSAAIFGIRGGTGVINAYTRRPGYQGFIDVKELVMLGYHAPGEFYSDLLSGGEALSDSRKGLKTVHWDPYLVSDEDGRINVRFAVPRGTERIELTIEGAGLEGGIGSTGYTIDISDPARGGTHTPDLRE